MIKALAAAVLLLLCVACGQGSSAPTDQPEPVPQPAPTPGPAPHGEICDLRVSDESTNQEIALEFNRLRRDCGWTEEQAEAAALEL